MYHRLWLPSAVVDRFYASVALRFLVKKKKKKEKTRSVRLIGEFCPEMRGGGGKGKGQPRRKNRGSTGASGKKK